MTVQYVGMFFSLIYVINRVEANRLRLAAESCIFFSWREAVGNFSHLNPIIYRRHKRVLQKFTFFSSKEQKMALQQLDISIRRWRLVETMAMAFVRVV